MPRAAFLLALGMALLPALVPVAAPARDGTPALLARLKADLSLTDAESAALDAPVRAHLAQGGREQGLRDLLSAALAAGCREACAVEAVASTNRALAAGMRPMEALERVRGDLADAVAAAPGEGPPSEGGLAAALRTRMDAHLATWQPPPAPAPAPEPAGPPKRPRLF